MPPDHLAAARRVAADVLAPAATAVDLTGTIPPGHFDALADAGLYGVNLRGADPDGFGAVVETLAAACLSTTFVWLQHHHTVAALSGPGAPGELQDRWLDDLVAGRVRSGVSLAGIMPRSTLTARPSGSDWMLSGAAPWLTGWGLVDVLLVLARGPDDTLVRLLIDAPREAHVTVERPPLVAVQASSTAHVTFDDLPVPAERVISVEPMADAAPVGLTNNGYLSVGLIARCAAAMDSAAWRTAAAAARPRLAGATDDDIAAVRADLAALALRAAGAYVVHCGSRSVRLDEPAQRAVREATFLLVFGSRPAIKTALLTRLAP